MAVIENRIVVTAAPTLLSVGAEADFIPGRSFAVHNPGPASIYLGGSTVSDDTGFELGTGLTFAADLRGGDAVYGAVAGAAQEVHVLQVGR